MLSRKITDGTEFVVFDMEWNQPMPGKEYPFEVSKLTGEIIEIGAFKYVYDNGELIYKDSFSTDIAPVKYTKLHYHVKKVTHKKNADLLNGIPFKDAYSEFRSFCGDAILVGWGSSDPSMLKMNLEFFGMDSKLDMFFLDLQPIFSLFAGGFLTKSIAKNLLVSSKSKYKYDVFLLFGIYSMLILQIKIHIPLLIS